MKRYRPVLILLLTFLTWGCYQTMADLWGAFDARMKADVGVKTTQYYYAEWGRPAKQRTLADGSQEIRWEMRGYGGAQGWDKTLVFDPDGKLRSYTYDYWPKD
jgi:hypothetical protein